MTIQDNIKVIIGHTDLRLTDFPYYDRRKKQEDNGLTINFFCMEVYGT